MKSLLLLFTFYLFSSLAHNMGLINGLDPEDLDQTEPELTDDGYVGVDEVASGFSDDDFIGVDDAVGGNHGSSSGVTTTPPPPPGIHGSSNGLFPNGLFPNGLFPNGWSPNGVYPNGWTPNGWTSNGFTNNGADVTLTGFTLSAIDSFRENNPENTFDELLPYLVHCALPPWKSWVGTLNGEETEIWGELGLAADLDQIPMLPTQQQLVSACLLSLVNYFGHHIYISSRNYPSVAATKDEMKIMDVYEGAFFGDLFSEDVKKFSCLGTPSTVALAQSPDREWRRCTDPEYDCEIEVLGDCSEICSQFTEDYGYSQCLGSDGVNYPALNVFLSKRNRNQIIPQ
jgi:hypothetical protein